MHKFFLFFLLLLEMWLAAPPQLAHADLIPCGKSSGTAEQQAPCTMCHFVVAGNNLLKWGLGIMTVTTITVILAMSILYTVSAGNPGVIQTAKGGILAVLVGFGVMLTAWLIVNTILSLLVNTSDASKPFGGLVQNGTFQFTCDTASLGNTGYGNGNETPGSTGMGTCSTPSSGPCSPASLQSTCFGGSFVNTWSAICYGESSGIATIGSSTDKCALDGNIVSWGLFQINISANRIGSLNCPTAFSSVYTSSNHNCRVINQSLYDQCVAAAKDPAQNIATACSLAAPNATNTGPWGAARRCNFNRTLP